MKKIFSFIFCIFLSVSSSLSYAGVVSGTCGTNLQWSLNTKDSTLTITGSGKITSKPWYDYRDYIAYVNLPEGLTETCYMAFAYLSKVKSFNLPSTLKVIGQSSFYECSGIKSIEFPDSLTTISYGAFQFCEKLDSVKLPSNLTTLGDAVFYSCEALTTVTIPNKYTSIPAQTFMYCHKLKSVIIGSGVTSIGNNAFKNYTNSVNSLTVYAKTPPSGGVSCGILNTNCDLYVRADALSAYQNAIWWEDFKSINGISLEELPHYSVSFVDGIDTILTSSIIIGEGATPPTAPVHEGYTFVGWEEDYSNIVEDLVVHAKYEIIKYNVSFYDWDNSLLKKDTVEYQSAASAPSDPVREGYTFTGWDKEFSSVTSDLDVYAQYEEGEKKSFNVLFNDKGNNVVLSQQVEIRVPIAPEFEGFTFLNWQVEEGELVDNIIIKAIYQAIDPTSSPAVYVNPSNTSQKLIREGQVYVLSDDTMYTINGQKIK